MKPFKSLIPLLPLTLLAVASQAVRAEGAVYEYPQPIVSSVSRADVRAQAVAARDAGTLTKGEADFELPRPVLASGLTRVQVVAEAIEARRLGLIPHGEAGVRDATPAELDRVRLAGLRALQQHLAARH